jgi:hypothetical protein
VSGIAPLLGAELRRFFSRRVMRLAFALGIALATSVLAIQTVRSEVSTVTQRHQTFECFGTPSSSDLGVPPSLDTVPQDCVPQSATSTVVRDRRLRIHETYSDTVKGTGFAMVFIAFVIGASFVGAEFGAGSLSTQLLFEPRRVRVVAVKAVAVGIGIAVLSIAILLYIGLLQWAGSSWRGVVNDLDGTWFAARAGDIVRVTGAAALAGIAAYAITVVTRRTVAAVGGLLVIGWVSAIIGSLRNWRWVAKYNPATAFIAMVADVTRSHTSDDVLAVRGATISACLWAVGLTLVAAAIFSRREVR